MKSASEGSEHFSKELVELSAAVTWQRHEQLPLELSIADRLFPSDPVPALGIEGVSSHTYGAFLAGASPPLSPNTMANVERNQARARSYIGDAAAAAAADASVDLTVNSGRSSVDLRT